MVLPEKKRKGESRRKTSTWGERYRHAGTLLSFNTNGHKKELRKTRLVYKMQSLRRLEDLGKLSALVACAHIFPCCTSVFSGTLVLLFFFPCKFAFAHLTCDVSLVPTFFGQTHPTSRLPLIRNSRGHEKTSNETKSVIKHLYWL